MPFDLKQLRYALAAAKLGSYHHAARHCDVEENTIVEAIAALDERLRLALFETIGSGVLPTAAGRRFLREVEHLLWRADQIASLMTTMEAQTGYSDELPDDIPIGEAPCACGDHLEPVEFEALSPIAGAATVVPAGASTGAHPDTADNDYVELCRSILAARKVMGRVFGSDLFADPPGEMLLDLYVREHDEVTTSITKTWNASNASYGTARRSLAIMEERGLIARVADVQDGRRTLVQLTKTAREELEACLDIILRRADWGTGDGSARRFGRKSSG